MICYKNFTVNLNTLLNIDNIRYFVQKSLRERGMMLIPTAIALKKEFSEYLKPFGLRSRLMIFYQPAGDLKQNIHTDFVDCNTTHHFSFNLLVQGQGKMIWYYEPDDDGKLFEHSRSPNDILYKTYPNANLKVLDTWTTGNAALVKTGLPHGVENSGIEDRICLSIRIDDIRWAEAEKILLDYFRISLINQ
jgi:hypothetical protein